MTTDDIAKLIGTRKLVGFWFHSRDARGEINWQGQVIRKAKHGCYIVQLYSWLTGAPTDRACVAAESMRDWTFYGSDLDMRHHADMEGDERRDRARGGILGVIDGDGPEAA